MSSWKPTPPKHAQYKQDVFNRAGKVASFIYQIGETDTLRQPSRQIPLEEITKPETQQKIAYLKQCLLRYRKLTGFGRGISAVQVGIPDQMAITYGPTGLICLINPTITNQSKKLYRYPEICMSANPIIVPTIRPAWIEFEYCDEFGKKQVWNKKDTTKLNRMLNRVFQHEIDHLAGVINIDKVTDQKMIILESDPKFYDEAGFEEV